MKKIGITTRIDHYEAYDEVRLNLDLRWLQMLYDYSYQPVILPAGGCSDELFESFNLHGLILTGGGDLSIISDSPEAKLRDNIESAYIQTALKKRLPILGVCRGMLLLAARSQAKFKKIEKHVTTRHKLRIMSQSPFAQTLAAFATVNSYHNFSIDKLPGDFNTVAVSEDNIIEAIEDLPSKMYGIMFHPERDYSNLINYKKLFDEIFNAG